MLTGHLINQVISIRISTESPSCDEQHDVKRNSIGQSMAKLWPIIDRYVKRVRQRDTFFCKFKAQHEVLGWKDVIKEDHLSQINSE